MVATAEVDLDPGRRLRVVLVSPYGPARDGIARYAMHFAAAMSAEDCDVAVITPRAVHSAGGAVLIGDLEGGPRQNARLEAAVAAWSPDVVHVQFAVAAFAGRVPSLLRFLDAMTVPVVVTAHEVTRDVERLGALGRRIYRRIAATASGVVVHTDLAARMMRSISPAAEVRVVPHPDFPAPTGVADEAGIRRRFGLDGREVILMFGFVHPHKGLDDLVAAFAEARRAPNSDLGPMAVVVAGDVRRRFGLFRLMELPDRLHLAAVRSEVARLGLDESVVFAGYVEDGDVAAWFHLARAVVLPYRKIDQSGVLVLARALGSPVILSDAGGFAEEVDLTWMFPAGDRGALAHLLARLGDERPPQAAVKPRGDMVTHAKTIRALYGDRR